MSNMSDKKASRKKKYNANKYVKKEYKTLLTGTSYVIAPEHIDYLETRFDSVNEKFLDNLKYALKNFDSISLSFRYTKSLKVTPLLVIYSIIDTYGKNKKINVILSQISDMVNTAITSTGNFESAEHRFDILKRKEGLPVIQGNNAEVIQLQKKIIDTLVELYLDKTNEKFTDRRFEIGIAIQETLDNVGRHAYPNKEHHERLWWFWCGMIDGKLYIAIYDMGKGIPNTILNSSIDYMKLIEQNYKNYDLMKNKLIDVPLPTVSAHIRETISDEVLIRSAMSSEISTTTKEKHGKGSSRIKALIKNEKESFLLIFSCKGLYQYSLYDETNNQNGGEIAISLSNSLCGTLIQWSL